ncbi:hypothetical protein ACFO9Q_20600 [Paenibacillus sp. GCM10023252]|uniref:hypothetical protein n=1 Tax=Paenibacillus sp. GCM10023252 TaxID=3252649 RepID=UPI00360CA45C
MAKDTGITSDQLAYLALTLSFIGDGIGLLALEKLKEETEADAGAGLVERRKAQQTQRAMQRMLKRRR